MRASLAPAPVGLVRLLAKTERDAERLAAKGMDAFQHPFDERRMRLAGLLARLEHKTPVSRLERPFRLAEDLVGVHPVTANVRVALADAAVEAVLLADVPALDQSAEGDGAANLTALHRVGGGKKLLRIWPGQKLGQLPVRQGTRPRRRLLQ